MCPTKPLLIHLVRGVLGVAFLVGAFSFRGSLPVVALLLGGGALVAFRGCPTCWLAGLFEVARGPEVEKQDMKLTQSTKRVSGERAC